MTKLKPYAIQYHKRGHKEKSGYEIYLAKTSEKARKMFKKDFGKSLVIDWVKRS